MENVCRVVEKMGYVAFPLDSCTGAHGCLGDIVYTSLFGRPIVVLNSIDAARDLLDKKGANYSSRSRSALYEDL